MGGQRTVGRIHGHEQGGRIMALIPTKLKLAQSLHQAHDIRLSRIDHIGDHHLMLLFRWKQRNIKFSCSIIEIFDADLPPEPPKKEVGERRSKLKDLPVQALTGARHPLYFNEQWLREKLEEHGTQAALARAYGYSNQAVSEACQRFNIRTRARIPASIIRQVERELEGGGSPRAIAVKFGISKPSVRRIQAALNRRQRI